MCVFINIECTKCDDPIPGILMVDKKQLLRTVARQSKFLKRFGFVNLT